MAKAKGKKNKTSASRLKELKSSYHTLRDAMPTIGEEKEPPNGLPELAERVQGATVLDDDYVGVVSASGNIYKGDMVTLTQELGKKGESIRIANGEATMLATTTVNGTVVIVFVQDDDTFIKTAHWSGSEWQLGPTQTLVEGPLDKVILVPHQTGTSNNPYGGWWYLSCFYEEENADGSVTGMVRFFHWTDATTLTDLGSDIWYDGSLTNLCAAWTPSRAISKDGMGSTYNRSGITLAGLNGEGKITVVEVIPTYMWNSEENRSYLVAQIGETKSYTPGAYVGPTYLYGKLEDFTIPEPDSQEYASNAWNLIASAHDGSMMLVYPGEDGKRYALEINNISTDNSHTPAVAFKYEPSACKRLMMDGQLPCGAGIGKLRGPISAPDMSQTIIVSGIARTSGPNQKACVGVESWLNGFGYRLMPLWCGEEDQSYGKNVGLLSCCHVGTDKKGTLVAVGYSVEEKYRAFLLYIHEKSCELIGGPSVELADVDTAGAVVTSGSGAAIVWQKSKSIFLQQMEAKDVVVNTGVGSVADGVAVTGARAGQEVQIRRM